MIKIAVLGYGTVGSGVVEVIEKNKDMVNKKAGEELEVKYILDLLDFPDDPYGDRVIHDFGTILADDEIRIICETMGGVGKAYEFTKLALQAGKSVCTSNKELVAAHGPELLALAKSNNCNYLFEASVGGGIPIIRPLNYSLTAERIEAITGILNGTTNYILSKMEYEGADYETVLKEAQEKGYAERNPEADVEGHDACRKIAILSSLMTGKNVDYRRIYTEGITGIQPRDFAYAKQLGMSIKLLAVSREEKGKTLAMVSPFLIDAGHPLHMVNGVFNAGFVRGNMLGDSMYYGRGAAGSGAGSYRSGQQAVLPPGEDGRGGQGKGAVRSGYGGDRASGRARGMRSDHARDDGGGFCGKLWEAGRNVRGAQAQAGGIKESGAAAAVCSAGGGRKARRAKKSRKVWN